MTETNRGDGPPPFDDPFEEQDVEKRLYAAILQTREPTAASTLAETADCDPKTARKYLQWFSELGIVTRHEGRPTTYERNDAYFEWRRVNRLAAERSLEDLRREVTELTEKIQRYEQEYGASSPGKVDAVSTADERPDSTIDAVYADLADWETAYRERRLYERARQQRAGSTEQASG
jgi:predicted transcriptional regulator